MARGRMLNTTVAIDRRLNALSIESQLLYLMTIPHLDRDGLIIGDAPLLAAKAIPRRTELHARVEDLIQEWIIADLVLPYDADDGRVLFFPSFRKNQSFQYAKEGASQFQPPPGYHRTKDGLEPDGDKTSANSTLEQVYPNSRQTQELGTVKLSEVEEKLKENTNGASAGAVAPILDPFATCLSYLDTPKANKVAALARLYTLRFGDTYPPDYARLGKLAKELSGEYKALAQVIWSSSVPEGDPHDYLQRTISKSKARHAQADSAQYPSAVY